MSTTVSIIITIFNGEKWINECFDSILQQRQTQTTTKNDVSLEVCVYDDCSTDNTAGILERWRGIFENSNIQMRLMENTSGKNLGVGFGRNRAIERCSGEYLCFQDIDDVMHPNRIADQLMMAKRYKNALIGSKFERTPANSTHRFTNWANRLLPEKLKIQIFTSNGPTILMPTWFCHKSVFERIGGFSEKGSGTPEDLIFFYDHLDAGGDIYRVDEKLLNYRYHPNATTFSIDEDTIWKIRLNYLIKTILWKPPWVNGFTIWNAGKQGRKFYRDLPEKYQSGIIAFCDVDKNKIGKTYNHFDVVHKKQIRSIPIVHFTKAQLPIVVCIKMDLYGGFEENLNSLNLKEGIDYILFS